MKTNVSGVNAKFQVKTPLQSMHIFLPLLRLSFLSPMETGIKTWIQPLPDPSNKKKNRRGHDYQGKPMNAL
jgi:hypothetical protein